ncbi:sensor histidine kinase [Microbulbifer sediminum]|uniref:sensor histidine kinase n=1 Tax=Microbulbifer sediminum TaxID=2904250 RepID=UPI001EFF67FC|nr:two-component regulator propeller domain-containing protein [Microbulbifer sediminum]
MTGRATRLLLAAVLLLMSRPLLAQQPVEFRPLGVAHGLDVKVVPSLLVDRAGLLWVATREGLFRYDGYQARLLPVGVGGAGSLPDDDIRSLYEDRHGHIWIASNTAGLSRYDPQTGRFRHFRHRTGDPQTLSHESIYGMAEDASGDLWVGSQIGLNRLDPESGLVERFLHDPADPRSIAHDYVFTVHADRDGAIWIATVGGGVSIRRPGREGFDRIDLSARTGGPAGVNDVFGLAEASDGAMYAATRNGLVFISPGAGEIRHIPIAPESSVEQVITDLAWGPRGRLWMTTMTSGVLVYDPEGGGVYPANPESLGLPGQLPSLPQMNLVISGQRIFVGTWGGGVHLGWLPEEPFVFLNADAESSNFRNRNVTAVFADNDERPWVGTFGGGPQPLSPDRKQVERLQDVPKALAHDGVIAITRRRNGDLVAGTNHGLWFLPAGGKSAELVTADSGRGLGQGYVTSVTEDELGALWAGVGGSGLYRLAPAGKQFESFSHVPQREESLSGNYISGLLALGDRLLLVGTRSSGLNLCRTDQWSCQRYGVVDGLGHHSVTGLHRSGTGDLWVGTNGGGLHQFTLSATGRLQLQRRWTERDGLLSDNVVGIVEDDDGSLWISSRDGLTRLQPATGALINHVAASGLPVTQFNVRATARDEDYLYFGGLGGVVLIPPGTPMREREPSAVRLIELTQPDGHGGLRIQPASALTEYSINWGEMFSVSYAVLDYARGRHEYQYRLSDEVDWQAVGDRHFVTLLELSPGSHQLRIRGRDTYGNWSISPALELEVIPPIWMTAEFRIGGLFLLVIGTWRWHRHRVRGLRRRNRQLEQLQQDKDYALQEVKESREELSQAHSGLRNLTRRLQTAREEQRQEISRELHDELGQTLTATKISLQRVGGATDPGAAQGLLGAPLTMIDHMIAQVRNISLSLRPPLLDEAGLVEALRVHLDSVSDRAAIPIGLKADSELSSITAEFRITIFRLVQEAVSNTIRHADASRIDVRLRHDGQCLTVEIEDDGCGFEPLEVWRRARRGEHLGLLGMLERVHGVGGEMNFDSSPGAGCRVTATIPG